MMNIVDIINNDGYIKVPLVGNKYCNKKPSKNDVNIQVIKDINNSNDKNALKVISVRKDIKYLLGYIIKDKIPYVNSLLDKLKFITLIKKNNNKNIYYYLVFKII